MCWSILWDMTKTESISSIIIIIIIIIIINLRACLRMWLWFVFYLEIYYFKKIIFDIINASK
jgi:hypothetical protein